MRFAFISAILLAAATCVLSEKPARAQCEPARIDWLRGDVGSAAVGSSFGFTVSISGDGRAAVVGDPEHSANVGRAFVFAREGAAWSEGEILSPLGLSNAAQFGEAVAMSGDGNTLVVGAPYDGCTRTGTNTQCPAGPIGAALVFVRTGSGWVQQGPKLQATGGVGTGPFGVLGRGVALSADGNTALIGARGDNWQGAYGSGAAYIFVRSGATWTQQGPKLAVGDGLCVNINSGCRFGESLALNADGTTAAIGAPGDDLGRGAVYFFARGGGNWTQQGPKFTPPSGAPQSTGLGECVAIAGDGNTALAGASGDGPHGSVWVFTRAGSVWTQQGVKLLPTGAQGSQSSRFGSSVAIAGNGNTAVIGALNDAFSPPILFPPGAVYVFDGLGTAWTQRGSKITWCTQGLGTAVAISADGGTALAACRASWCGGEYCDGVYAFNIGPQPSCPADFDCSGAPTVADIFGFLRVWFAAEPRGDFNGVDCVTTADIFAFLTAWFAGCP